MPKILIIEPTLVDFQDDRGGQHADVADLPDVPKAIAAKLVEAGRALYTDRKDDPTKTGQFTASADMVKAAKAMAKARAELAGAEPQQPAGEGGAQ